MELACTRHGLTPWTASFQLFSLLGNKLDVLELIEEISIPTLPSICEKVDNYEDLIKTG
jgi:hypothetical protein